MKEGVEALWKVWHASEGRAVMKTFVKPHQALQSADGPWGVRTGMAAEYATGQSGERMEEVGVALDWRRGRQRSTGGGGEAGGEGEKIGGGEQPGGGGEGDGGEGQAGGGEKEGGKLTRGRSVLVLALGSTARGGGGGEGDSSERGESERGGAVDLGYEAERSRPLACVPHMRGDARY
eukprot:3499823-Rhodomonas_salina.2